MRDRSTKMLAVLMVSLMAVVALAPLAGEETDAAVGDGGTYSYTLSYDSTKIGSVQSTTSAISVDGMTAISHTNTGTLESLNEGSWTWNEETGVGPFNSFYAAFDAENSNAFVARLNPYDLSKDVFNNALPSGNYNYMWIVPTVYWSVTNDNLTLTNDPSSGGTAYAHTIDGHTYAYLAIGVYPGSIETVGGTSTLMSKTGSTVAKYTFENKNGIDTFRQYAYNNNVSELSTNESTAYSGLWKFYQWNLYRYCSLILMENFNSQSIVGNGIVYNADPSSLTITNGSLDNYGPYAGVNGNVSTSDSSGTTAVKLFLENAWGTSPFFVDGAYYAGSDTGLVVDTSHTPSDMSSGAYVEIIGSSNGGNIGLSNWIGGIQTAAKTWGMTKVGNSGGGAEYGMCDYSSSSGTNKDWIFASNGAYSSTGSSNAYKSGINQMKEDGLGYSVTGTSRLAFVFDSDLPLVITREVTINVNEAGYGTVSGTSPVSVNDGTSIAISGDIGNVLTMGDVSITATPAATTSEYTYSFDGWFNGSTQLQTGDTVDDDMTITAKFSRAAILTVTLDAGSGSVGTTTITVIEGQPIGDLPTPTPKGGYTFLGWFDSEGNEVTPDTVVTETESFTLHAEYELDPSLKPVKAMTDLLPLIFVVGIILVIVGSAFYYYRP